MRAVRYHQAGNLFLNPAMRMRELMWYPPSPLCTFVMRVTAGLSFHAGRITALVLVARGY